MGCCKLLSTCFFRSGHFGCRDVVVTLVVEGVNDRSQDGHGERDDRQWPHVPDHGKTKHGRQTCNHDASASVRRHVDRGETSQRALVAVLLHVRPGIDFIHHRCESEVVLGRRRRSGPFQSAAFPWIASLVTQLIALEVADHELDQERSNAQGNQSHAAGGDDEPDLQGWIFKVVGTTSHAHQTQDVQGSESNPEADQPEPEAALAPELV